MSLVAVYDALKEAKVSDQKATAAVEALEANREEKRLRNIEERIIRLEWMGRANMILTTACLILITGVLLRVILA